MAVMAVCLLGAGQPCGRHRAFIAAEGWRGDACSAQVMPRRPPPVKPTCPCVCVCVCLARDMSRERSAVWGAGFDSSDEDEDDEQMAADDDNAEFLVPVRIAESAFINAQRYFQARKVWPACGASNSAPGGGCGVFFGR